MNRKAIRDLAAKELGLKLLITDTQPQQPNCKSRRSKTINEFVRKGQSTIKSQEDIAKAWNYAAEGSRRCCGVIVAFKIQFRNHFANRNPK
jgi:phosphoribosylglycinamide formyltransferase 2